MRGSRCEHTRSTRRCIAKLVECTYQQTWTGEQTFLVVQSISVPTNTTMRFLKMALLLTNCTLRTGAALPSNWCSELKNLQLLQIRVVAVASNTLLTSTTSSLLRGGINGCWWLLPAVMMENKAKFDCQADYLRMTPLLMWSPTESAHFTKKFSSLKAF